MLPFVILPFNNSEGYACRVTLHDSYIEGVQKMSPQQRDKARHCSLYSLPFGIAPQTLKQNAEEYESQLAKLTRTGVSTELCQFVSHIEFVLVLGIKRPVRSLDGLVNIPESSLAYPLIKFLLFVDAHWKLDRLAAYHEFGYDWINPTNYKKVTKSLFMSLMQNEQD